ncbi:Amiloride-sensitive sodium channel [Nesidiocoris tenuis]|uniref:Amiloride-sensitive sodium channel n=1 Tax=Nesidiocoris tenuis TaxID=355587 RepID=A0ABN7AVM6_9HEMI|nr:Amiloride-sensitive sodium channel [Nesidiocoris tenuis]
MGKLFDTMTKGFAIMRDFFEHTSLHGFRYIAEEERHRIERLLWTVLCLLSWIGSGMLFRASYTAFQENSVSYGVERMILGENTSCPSVSVCEYENVDVLYDRANELYGEDHDNNLDEVLRELTFFKGYAYYLKNVCNKDGIECPRGNFAGLARKVRTSCEGMFIECRLNGVEFDCCKHFMPIETELGTCFSFSERNEMKLKDKGEPDWFNTMVSSEHVKLPQLIVEFNPNVTFKVYLHSAYDVPYFNTLSSDIINPVINEAKFAYITIAGTENPPEVRELSVYQRKCRFHDENNLESADFYSYSACVVDCRRRAQMELCNCTSHFMPKTKTEEHCDYDGIICLDKYYGYLSSPKGKYGGNNDLVCDCVSGCEDIDFNVVHLTQKDLPDFLFGRDVTSVQIKLLRHPNEKYRRIVVRGFLDLVVSIGGAAGLFLGASLLTILEVTYYFLFRAHLSEQQDRTVHNPKQDEERPSDNDIKPQVAGNAILPLDHRSNNDTQNGKL